MRDTDDWRSEARLATKPKPIAVLYVTLDNSTETIVLNGLCGRMYMITAYYHILSRDSQRGEVVELSSRLPTLKTE